MGWNQCQAYRQRHSAAAEGLSLETSASLGGPSSSPGKVGRATGSDSPDSEEREAEGGAGRRKKGYFKAHKITVSWTAQDERWLLPKLCRYVQILCKLATQRWQGALADSLALEPSQSVSLSLVQGAERRSCHLPGSKKGGDRICLIPASCQLPLWESRPPRVGPLTYTLRLASGLDC